MSVQYPAELTRSREEATKELKAYKGNDFVTDVSSLSLNFANLSRPCGTPRSNSLGTRTIRTESS